MSTLEFVKSLELQAMQHREWWPFARKMPFINHIKWFISVREQLKELTKQFDKSENDLKALQSVGQIVGEVLKQLTEDKCKRRNYEWKLTKSIKKMFTKSFN